MNGHLPSGFSKSSVEQTLREQLKQVTIEPLDDVHYDPSILKVSFVQAEKALTALKALSSGLSKAASPGTKAEAFEVFQREFIQSHVGLLQSILHQTLSNNASPQLSTARQVAALALMYISNVILSDRDVARAATHTVSTLRRTAQEGATKAKHMSVATRGVDGALIEGEVKYEMEKIKSQIESSFQGRLSWLGLLGRLRVDDVALELGGFVGSRFAVDLERQVSRIYCVVSRLQAMTKTRGFRWSLNPVNYPTCNLPFRRLLTRLFANYHIPAAHRPNCPPTLTHSLLLSLPITSPHSRSQFHL